MAINRALSTAAVAAFLAFGIGPATAETTIKLIPQADLKIFDPIWTTAAISINHGYMVYDTLFAMDSKLQPKPQMVESFTSSPDGLKHTFTLRSGLKFHDGSPVTAKDVVVSLNRWGKRIVDGKAMFERTASLVATGDRTLELTLKDPFGPLFDVLANPVQPAVIMREKDALTDPNQQVMESIGSGPFVFLKDEWKPGDKVFYRKNADYAARSDASDGFAGAKVVKVDRVEWDYIPDPNTATQALLKGEVDAYEIPPVDLLPLLKKDPNIVVRVLNKPGVHGMIRPNALYPPFKDTRARQALALAIDQKQYLAAMVGNDSEYGRECYAVFQCGSPNETTVGSEPYQKRNIERAKQLMKEAGYDGRPIVVMDPTDQQIIHNIAIMTAQSLKDIGVNVDLQAMDWASLTSRRANKDKPGSGSQGWDIFTTWSSSIIMQSPITNFAMVATCDGNNWYGWACDDELEKRRKDYVSAQKPEERKKAIEGLQVRYYEIMPFVITGQFQSPVAYRKNLVGIPDALLLELWNVEKK
ncbi:MAG: ABC transporter substrate-binding protein [Proteobacteria bacterium]|nr:ABC transporter substrate-binding protein [Pseudomonadota bacterium]